MRDGPLFALLLAALVCYCCGRTAEADEQPSDHDRILAVLQSATPSRWDADETRLERGVRLDALAHAIDHAARSDEERAALLAIGGAESNWAGYVVQGCTEIPDGASNCDGGRARSPWQMHEAACRAGWALPRGSVTALDAFAVCARKRFLGSLKRCDGRHPSGDRIAGAMAGYRGGHQGVTCRWEGRPHDGARARSRLYSLRLGQLRAAQ